MENIEQKIQEQPVKSYEFKKGGVTLAFSLNLAKQEEVKAFADLLEAAREVVLGEIKPI